MTPTSLRPATESVFPPGVLRLDYASDVDGRADWALVYPCPGSSDWLVCVHGHGSGGDQLYVRPDIRDLWLPTFRLARLNILTPHLRGSAWMGPAAAADLHGLIGWLRGEQGGRRFILASGSMGGTSSLLYAAVHPGDVAGVVALCPATDLTTYHAWCRGQAGPPVLSAIADAIESGYDGSPQRRAAAYEAHSAVRQAARLAMPVFVSHGEHDAVIPADQARRLAQVMRGRPNFHYEELPGGDHEIPLTRLPKGLAWVADRLA